MAMEFAAGFLAVLLVIALFAGPVVIGWWFAYGDTSFSSGYVATDKSTIACLQKTYQDVTVKFYNWGAFTDSFNVKNTLPPDGVYAIISSPRNLVLKSSGLLFDEVEIDTEKGCVITAKKRGIFMGEQQMHDFLAKFDELFRQDLSDRA